MKRRSLLTMIPAASALLAMRSKGAPVPQPALTEAGFSIAVQCWSFNKFTLFQAIEMAAATGAGSVELYPGQPLGGDHGDAKLGPELPADKLRAVLDHLRKHGLVATNYGVTAIPKAEPEARKLFEFAKQLGLYGLTTESIEAIDTLEKLAVEYDLKVGFHNHPKPTGLWHPDTIWKVVDGRHRNLGYCADTGHWASSGLDPLAVIKKIAPRVVSFHLKDRASLTEWTHDRPLGTGIVNLPAILDEVRQHGFAGNVSLEYEHNWDTSLAEIAQCVGYLRAYGKLRA